jgi:hypothetical protein
LLGCALEIDGGDLATAQSLIADDIKDCSLYVTSDTDATTNNLDGTVNGQIVSVSFQASKPSPGFHEARYEAQISISCPANTLVTFSSNLVFESVSGTRVVQSQLNVFDSNGVVCSETVPYDVIPVECLIPSEGIYRISFIFSVTGQYQLPTYSLISVDIDSTLTFDKVVTVNPAIVSWDDSGTTRKLWACPRMIIPTTFGNSWYASEADALAVLNNPLKVSGCVGYFENNFFCPSTGFTATGGGSFSCTVSGMTVCPNTGYIWCSFNGVKNATITMTASPATFVNISIYDFSGNSLESESSATNSITSGALPYTGQYTIQFLAAASSGVTSITITITSSNTMSTNLIQALYDVDLDCPARLDC